MAHRDDLVSSLLTLHKTKVGGRECRLRKVDLGSKEALDPEASKDI